MDIALDLGTSRCRVRALSKKKGVDEPSVIAYSTDTGKIAAVGTEAESMLERTPPSIEAVYPLAGGVISDSLMVEDMINVFMGRICAKRIVMPRVVACIPGDITDVEKRAVVNAISSFGVRRVYLVESTKAAAMGAGMDIRRPFGNMVVDLGAGTVDIAVISLGGVCASKSLKRAGDSIDEEIIKFVRRKYSVIIGKQTACKCKNAIGSFIPPCSKREFSLGGRSSVSGLPQVVTVDNFGIYEAIKSIADEIASAVTEVLENTPPELTGDIYENGITLTGGLSLLSGVAELIAEKSGIKTVKIAKDVQNCVIKGCLKATADIADVESGGPSKINPLLEAY